MRSLGTDYIIVPEGLGLVNFNKMLALNSSAAYLWENIAGKEFSVEDLSRLLTDKYDVEPEIADRDAAAIAKSWIDAGVVEQ